MEQFFQDDVYNLYSDSSENRNDYKIPEMFYNNADNKQNNEGEKNKKREENLKIRTNSKKITKDNLDIKTEPIENDWERMVDEYDEYGKYGKFGEYDDYGEYDEYGEENENHPESISSLEHLHTYSTTRYIMGNNTAGPIKM